MRLPQIQLIIDGQRINIESDVILRAYFIDDPSDGGTEDEMLQIKFTSSEVQYSRIDQGNVLAEESKTYDEIHYALLAGES